MGDKDLKYIMLNNLEQNNILSVHSVNGVPEPVLGARPLELHRLPDGHLAPLHVLEQMSYGDFVPGRQGAISVTSCE